MKPVIEFWNRNKKINLFILKIGLAAILFYNLYSKFSGEDFHQTLQLFQEQFSWGKIYFLFYAVLLTFFNWGFETLKYFICIQRVEPISYWTAYRGILYGNALNLILPASLGELTGRPMVLKSENRITGSGVAYYVSIVQKVASPIIGLLFLLIAHQFRFLSKDSINILNISLSIASFIVLISVLDLVFWAIMYIKPHYILYFLEKIQSLKKIFQSIEQSIDYPLRTKLLLLSIGCFRFLIFVTQYWILMFLFFDHFPQFEFYILCGVYFLAQFVIPSLGFLDVGIRANLVVFVFSLYTQNFVQLMAVNYLIWVINLLVPSAIGFFLMRKKINPFEEISKK